MTENGSLLRLDVPVTAVFQAMLLPLLRIGQYRWHLTSALSLYILNGRSRAVGNRAPVEYSRKNRDLLDRLIYAFFSTIRTNMPNAYSSSDCIVTPRNLCTLS